MKVIRNLSYSDDGIPQHTGDLYLPVSPVPSPVVLCIHGGGWDTMDRSSFAGVAEFLCTQGLTVFNIDYRLLGTSPWAACGDDCRRAAEFLLTSKDERNGLFHEQLIILGASAGGHLALMTGLTLSAEKVAGMISIAGISDLSSNHLGQTFHLDPQRFWGHLPTLAEIREVSPLYRMYHCQPPILCIHFPQDNVISVEQSRRLVERAKAIGAAAELFEFERPLDGHSIWIPNSMPHRLFPEIEIAIADFVHRITSVYPKPICRSCWTPIRQPLTAGNPGESGFPRNPAKKSPKSVL